MTEQAEQARQLSAVVADAAKGVALALRGEGDPYALSRVLHQGEALAPAAVRVLGADALAPYALDDRAGPPGSEDARVVLTALETFRPGADASEVSRWSYRGLIEATQAFLPGGAPRCPQAPTAGSSWIATDPWPKLAHRASQLAALALPGLSSAPADALAARTDDLARGFVRAVRRRDWLQAAGLGRWLARLPGTPDTLGLDSGLAFVGHMGGTDPRVALHLVATQCFYGRGR